MNLTFLMGNLYFYNKPQWVKLFEFIFLTFFLGGCGIYEKTRFMYPSEKKMEINYLCNLPFFDKASQHQKLRQSNSSWLILDEEKAIIFFENNQIYKIKGKKDISLPDGKYSCLN